jgi:hypothetical protein
MSNPPPALSADASLRQARTRDCAGDGTPRGLKNAPSRSPGPILEAEPIGCAPEVFALLLVSEE